MSRRKIGEKNPTCKTIYFVCRGGNFHPRNMLWRSYLGSIEDVQNYATDNSYLTLVEEPNNPVDKNAIKVVVRGEIYGLVGYVGKEYTQEVKNILNTCTSYRVDMVERNFSEEREIKLVLSWCE